ncbi:hypothetical protein BGZ76_007770 [Entomortierella beljakovae]|nr:hypothetical protein BGZ76_007770 [Entomortierella beljakovae]
MPMTLPEECLWLIISHLRTERSTLHSLLLSNSTFFRIAATFLYASPFRLLQNERNYWWTTVERTKRYDCLTHLLLHSSNLLQDHYGDEVVSRLPRYGPEVTPLPVPSTVNYLTYYTELHHDPMLHETFMTLFPTIPNCYMANVIWYPSMVGIRNRIELAMMDIISPQITSMLVPLPIHVPRIKLSMMANLRRLEVTGTNYSLLEAQDFEWRVPGQDRLPTSSGKYAMTRLDKMLIFIWDHQRMFGTLRELKIENKTVPGTAQPDRLIELVEAMGDNLEVLDVQYWPEAVLYMDRIPTKRLRCLLLHTGKEPAPVFEECSSMSAFFGQCPNLQEISMYVSEKDLLRAWRPEIQDSGVSGLNFQSTSNTWHQPTIQSPSPSHTYHSLDMARMKGIRIAGLTQSVVDITNEATTLFAPSLESLVVRSWFSGILVTTSLSFPESTLEWLANLDLEGEVAWIFNYTSLLRCPRLSRIRLAFTGPMPRRSPKHQPAIDSLSLVYNLKDLELVGNWETLYNRGWSRVVSKLYYLERLDLSSCDGITADHVFGIVRDIIEQSYQKSITEGDNKSLYQKYLYSHCRLRWVIVTKKLEDGINRKWNDLKVQVDCISSQAKIETAPLFVKTSVNRIQFSFVVTARPSH